MKKRVPKKTDQENIEKGYVILKETMQSHEEIEPSLWAAAMWSCLVDGYINSDVPYEEFCKEWEMVKDYYKPWFKEK